jgi:phosphoenolpyruvate carboxylase
MPTTATQSTGTTTAPAPLRRDVGLLGALLGQALKEAEGPELLADVERLRHATIELRRAHGAEREARLRQAVALVAGFDLDRAELVARAFTIYFQLVNLAEEQHRVRTLRERDRPGGPPVRESLAAAVAEARQVLGDQGVTALLERLEIRPVLTAHPTEARRRAVVEALGRVREQVERLDDPRLSRSEQAGARRRLLEEISVLWRTAQLRQQRPTPLDEVRAVMAVFDRTLFRLVPALYRELDHALQGEAAGLGPPGFRPFLRWGSWVGGDRDGNPNVTAAVTRQAMEIQSEHVLLGLEAATRRIARSLPASASTTPPSAALAASLARDQADLPEAAEALQRRAPGEPHRQKLALAAERLARTRQRRANGYPDAQAFLEDLRLVQASLLAAGAPRLAHGELQGLIWQAETFGFHLASLEVRQHASLHAQAIGELAPWASGDPAALDRLAADGWPVGIVALERELSPATQEVLATLQAMADLQARWGPDACRRYVVSFTRGAADVVAVRALARLAVPDPQALDLDVVPLFESRGDLEAAPGVLDELLALPGWAAWLERRGRRLEVMLGYSDSAKDVGFLAANLALYRAQGRLAAWAREHQVELTLFHGRGGALGRGGGPAGRAIRGQAPGSVACRFKVTEQGEVIFARYDNPAIGLRHLEQVTGAVLVASTAAHEASLVERERRFAADAERMALAAEAAYRELVGSPGFADFFAQVTPAEELAKLPLGSRPDRRGGRPGRSLEDLRAIPWTFAWSQSRCNLPGWYGLGSGLAAVADEPGGLERLRAMYAEWPFFTSLLDNAEMSLAKADPLIAGLYLELGERPDLLAAIREELDRSKHLVLAVTGAPELLARRPVLGRAVALRNPYVDALNLIQLRALSELRRRTSDGDPRRVARLADLVLLTVNGVAAGLQNTG